MNSLLITGPGHPHFNMALDEVLLEAHRPGDLVVRLYQWAPHALSLGYFQPSAEAPADFLAEHDLVLTRRTTGGGAIVHAFELTYSLVADAPQGPGSSRQLYTRMNRAIIAGLSHFGILATERGEGVATLGGAFLCFERHADFDVVVGDDKIAGSAQRRKGGALLQHGSILLARPPGGGDGLTTAADHATGAITADSLSTALFEGLLTVFGSPFNQDDLSPVLHARAEDLVREKYGTEGWIRRV